MKRYIDQSTCAALLASGSFWVTSGAASHGQREAGAEGPGGPSRSKAKS
jgi:hypothetical protein